MQNPNQRIKVFPARRGWQWLMQSGDLIGQYRSVFIWQALLWVGVTLIGDIPVIGFVLLLLLMPGLQAGVMYAFDKANRREQPQVGDLFAVLSSPRRSMMLQLAGIVVVIALILVSIAISSMLPELLELAEINTAQVEQLPADDVQRLAMVLVVIMMMANLALLFAVPRVAFDGCRPMSAIVESIRVCVLNWRAVLIFFVAQIVVAMAASIIVMLLISVISLIGGTVGIILQTLIFSMFVMLFQVLVCGGQYLAWRDVFDHNKADAGDDPPPPEYDKLIA